MSKHNILHFNPNSLSKAMNAEAVIRHVKAKTYKYMAATSTKNWVSALPAIAKAHNSRPNRVTKLAPKFVNFQNARAVWERRYPHIAKDQALYPGTLTPAFQVGDRVRRVINRNLFTKGHTETFENEIFLIRRLIFGSVIRYKLEDLEGSVILGDFRKEHLILVSEPETEKNVEFRIS